jgi:hypothetical protein
MFDRARARKFRHSFSTPSDQVWTEHVVRPERNVHVRKDPPPTGAAAPTLKSAYEISSDEPQARLVLRGRRWSNDDLAANDLSANPFR